MGARGPRAPPLHAVAIAIAVLLALPLGLMAEQHAEELLLQPLADGDVLAHFEFSSAASLHAAHTRGFPPALLELVRRHGVAQLELSLTQGRWAWQQQQHPPAASSPPPKPSGLELKVSFQPGVRDTRAAYAALTQGLGGLLCAGVAMVPQLAVMAAPAAGWFPADGGAPWLAAAVAAAAGKGSEVGAEGAAAAQTGGVGGRQVYAWLGQEGVCTENLSAWRRLLPCRAAAGLGALPQAAALAAAPYYSLGLRLWVQPGGDGGAGTGQQPSIVQLRQVLTVVLPAGAADTQQQQQQQQQQRRRQPELVVALFGAGLPPACSAASSSQLYIAAGSALSGDPPPGCQRQATAAGALLACDLQQAALPQLPASLLQPPAETLPAQLQVVQHLVQQGGQAGTLVVGVRVASAAAAAAGAALQQQQAGGARSGGALVHVMQLLPWQLMVQARSVQLVLDGQALGPHAPELVWQAVDARPDRTAVVEALLRLPPGQLSNSSGAAWHEVKLSVAYRAAFVGAFDHAPDASRGVDVPPALANLLPAACDGSGGGGAPERQGGDGGSGIGGSVGNGDAAEERRGASSPLLTRLRLDCGAVQAYSGGGGGGLAQLPLPDFSMPFNVICFTSTLLAVLLGGAANAVLRSPAELAGVASTAGGTPRWRRKLRRLAALAVGMAALAIYLDKDLQRRFDAAAHHFALGRTCAPELHGEL
ncbi:GPI transamidase component PIG-T-like isoform X2 [Micractinium conductrix]|uniref:GPI transamidase component PIG-T-like isoform X2 n=1 Tax=Micractinium conductrix TaxID=554055 RepID=A0A2P6V1Y8_9CHLO|nr:GPI transamidase component PIG-T-like isoform X2 [Micractinium conductrix]|eukprot:PSC68107.1 GPI transamidase component PIG-T-like isoform X2 [Micractinium conductrix]